MYKTSNEGKVRKRASAKEYRATDKGRERLNAASQAYQRTEKGKARISASFKEYQSTDKGRARMRAASQEYRGTDKGRQQERRRYRRNDLYREFKEDVDPSQFDYGTSRNAVFKSIKEHNIAPGYLSKFSRLKSEIIKGKKTMYLPNLPADFNAQHKRGLFRSNNRFARSKNRKHWKISASNIFIKNVDAAMIDEVLQLWFPTLQFNSKSQHYKKVFVASQITGRALHVRDLWVRCLYSLTHKLNILAETIVNQDVLDVSKNKSADQILGWKVHKKGHEAYFPQYSYTDGKPFNFKYDTTSKKSKEKVAASEWCKKTCLPASEAEIKLFNEVLQTCVNLNVRNSRVFTQQANICANIGYNKDKVYQLIVPQRNHGDLCFQPDAANTCQSTLVMLRKLSVHYKNVRGIYDLLNRLKIADNFISDIDTASALGDLRYLVKVLSFKPHYSAKTFDVDRPSTIINEGTMAERFGEHYTQFLKKTSLLRSVPCVSCNMLLMDSPDEDCKTITKNWTKLNKPGSHYVKLLEYLQSEEWTRKGGQYVDTLIGKKICGYCWRKMNIKDEIPRIGLNNNMDIGIVPEVISSLNTFERLFIKFGSYFQTFLSLGTTIGNRPNNERMKAVKGFSVSIPVPIQANVDKLGDERLHKLIDPSNYILLHGLPSKERKVWTSLINVQKVFDALGWLIIHNPLYKNIRLPDSPDELLTRMNIDLEDMCEDDNKGCTVSTGSPPTPMESQVSGVSDLDSLSDKSLPRVSLGGTDTYLEDMCDSATDAHGGFLNMEDYEIEGLGFADPEDPGLKEMWDTAPSISNEEMQRIKNISSAKTQRKVITISCIKQMCRVLVSNATLCSHCYRVVTNTRSKLIDVVDNGGDVQLFDQHYLDYYFKELRSALASEESAILRNKCSLCCGSKIKSTPFYKLNLGFSNSKKPQRNNNGGFKDTPSSTQLKIEFDARYAYATKLKVLCELDELREKSVLCSKCHDKAESSMPRVIPHYYRPSFQNRCKVSSYAVSITTAFKKVCGLKKKADFTPWSIDSFPCVKCKGDIKPRLKLVPEKIDDQSPTSISPAVPKYEEEEQRLFMALKNSKTDAVSSYSYPTNTSTKQTRADNKANNIIYVKYILEDFTEARKKSLCCKSCLSSFREMKLLFTNLINSQYNEHHLSLKAIDTDVLLFLHLHYQDKLKESSETDVCFNCCVTILSSKDDDTDNADAYEEDTVQASDDVKGGTNYRNPHSKEDNGADDHTDEGVVDDDGGDGDHDSDDNDDDGDDGGDSVLSDYYDDGVTGDANDDNNGDANSVAGVDNDAADDDNLANAPDPSDGPPIYDPQTNQDHNEENSDAGEKEKIAMLEAMTEDDLKYLIEEYTVTGMGQSFLEDDPDLMNDLYKMLRLDDKAIDMDDNNLDLMAFPEVFSYGVGGKRGFRGEFQKDNPLQYEKARLLSANPASRRNTNYLFHLTGECERRRIHQSVMATIKNVSGLGTEINAGVLLDKIKNRDPKLLSRINKVLRKVPNTKPYWESQRAKLLAQIQEFGPPTFFATFSPAEYDWEDLIRWLRERNSDLPDVHTMSPAALMNIDPVLTSTYIHQKFDALWEFIIKAKPLGEVVSSFVRHEYQSRGTVHYHTFIWLKDSPVIGINSDKEVVDFIQEHVTCRVPDVTQEGTLFDVVGSYQNHVCGSYCLRTLQGKRKADTSKAACRFGFPRPKSKHFILHEVLSSVIGRRKKQMRRRLYDLARTEGERRINDYNPILSFLWRGNTDIQFVSENSYSICQYVTKYVLKAEESKIKLDKIKKLDTNKSIYQNYNQMAYDLLRTREMSAHEAADRILQNNGELWRSSEKFEYLAATMPNRRSRCLKPLRDLEAQNSDSKKLFFDNWITNFYPNRPNREPFANMSLYDFVKSYDCAKVECNEKKKETDEDYLKIYQDGQYLRTLKKRTKKPVIYYPNYSLEKEPELLYYSFLCLYKPWRREEDIKGDSATYEEEYFKAILTCPQLKDMSSKKLDIDKARKKMEEAADNTVENEDEENDDDDNEQIHFAQGIHDFVEMNNSSDIQTEEELQECVQTLNQQQRAIYDEVTEKVMQMVEHEKKGCSLKDCDCKTPAFLYVSGFGGTGKSYLIKVLKGFMYVRDKVYGDPINSALAAPTGLAARNISGLTLHALFFFLVEHGKLPKYSELKPHLLQRIRDSYNDLKLLIVDEISLVNAQLLFQIHMRMKQIFGGKVEFGGKCVVLFGDLLQLPPVTGKNVFEELTSDDINTLVGGCGVPQELWRLFSFRELTINQRQAGEENILWSSMLNRIRIGAHTPEDISILQERLLPLPPCELPSEYLHHLTESYLRIAENDRGAVCLMPKKTMVTTFNNAILLKLFSNNPEEVGAHDEVDGKTKTDIREAKKAVKKLDKLEDSRNTAGLEKSIFLCKGVRVMLRKNVDTARGLINGAMGTIVELVRPDDAPDGPVQHLMVHFDEINEVVAVKRVSGKVELFHGSFLERKQFPLSLGYSFTVHKAQGMSLKTVICDLGSQVFTSGMTYVALSRCKTLDGLHLINFNPQKITVDKAAINEYVRLGSVPVMNHEEDTTDKPPTLKGRKRKRPGQNASSERVWYPTTNYKRARSTIKTAVEEVVNTTPASKPPAPKTPAPQKPAFKKPFPKKKTPKKPTPKTTAPTKVPRPAPHRAPRPAPEPPRPLIHAQQCISKITRGIPLAYIPFTSIITDANLKNTYKNVLVPWSRRTGRDQEWLMRAASQLDPDPFEQRARNLPSGAGHPLWLEGSIINKYLTVLRDDHFLSNMPSIYNMGPYGYSSLTGRDTRSRGTAGKLKYYLDMTYMDAPLTRIRYALLCSNNSPFYGDLNLYCICSLYISTQSQQFS